MTHRTLRALVAGIAIALLWGCTSTNNPTVPDADIIVFEGTPFLLRVGETAGIQTQTVIVLVSFADVLGDTRCPEGSTCEEPGAATVRMSVQSALAIQDLEILVPPNGMTDFEAEELTVTVLQFGPAAQEGVEIPLLDYQIGLRVDQTGEIGGGV